MNSDKSTRFAPTSCDRIIALNIVVIKITFVMGKKKKRKDIEESEGLFMFFYSVSYFLF